MPATSKTENTGYILALPPSTVSRQHKPLVAVPLIWRHAYPALPCASRRLVRHMDRARPATDLHDLGRRLAPIHLDQSRLGPSVEEEEGEHIRLAVETQQGKFSMAEAYCFPSVRKPPVSLLYRTPDHRPTAVKLSTLRERITDSPA
jgi:hypothetical protein